MAVDTSISNQIYLSRDEIRSRIIEYIKYYMELENVDLTKSSDIIASRTYDYFFPLIIIALIYLLITGLLSKMLKRDERRLDINA